MAALRDILKGFPVQTDPNLLVGHGGADDAGVYRIDDDRALVLTVDFFTPIVDDPFDYGRVAATNSLSDVYAMGGRPLVALNIAAFPEVDLPAGALSDILRGGAEVAGAAGVVIAGGHTVKDKELKYGLSVVGMIDPKRIIENAGARDGDVLILTKALGTGILSTALRAGDLSDEHYDGLIKTMTLLNRGASELMMKHGVHACTDITGNGLFGHAFEMAQASAVTIEFTASRIPVLPGTTEAIDKHYLTGGQATNRRYTEGFVGWDRDLDESLEHVFYDPQTSGGLLIALGETDGNALLDDLKDVCPDAAVVGRIRKGDAGLRVG